MKTIYLDNNATTQVAPEVLEEMTPYFHELYGNPSSAHTFGGQVGKKIREARESAAELLGVEPQEILFTSCGSESDNAAIRSALQLNPDKRHIVTSRVEHPAIKSLCEHLATMGYRVTEVPVDKEGNLDMAVYKESLTRDTAIATIMWGNNETGVIFPVEEAAQLAKERGILFHSDGVQVAGKIPINLKNSRVDMLSLSGHKLHGPKGVGILYIRKGDSLFPFHHRRPPGDGAAGRHGKHRRHHRPGKGLSTGTWRTWKMKTPGSGIFATNWSGESSTGSPRPTSTGGKAERLPNTSNISFEFIEGEAILLQMDGYGICASSGSACTSGSLQPSHVLRAMGVPFTMAHGSIRFSLSIYNTPEEIDFVIETMPPIIEKLRLMSPFWDGKRQELRRR